MSDEDYEENEPDLDDDDLDEEALEVEDALDDEGDDIDLIDDELDDASPEVPVAVVTDDTPSSSDEEDDEEGVVDLDEEQHPDDVEVPLDALLQERTASATLEDDEEEIEEEEVDGDDRAELGDQALALGLGERRRGLDVETDLGPGGRLVGVLAARPAAGGEAPAQLVEADRATGRDAQPAGCVVVGLGAAGHARKVQGGARRPRIGMP